jgi:hypothetical protein
MIPRTLIPFCLASALAFATTSAASAGAPPREVFVTATRVHLGDVVPEADALAAAVDVGPSPAAGAARLFTRADFVAALEAKQIPAPATLPEAVRVVRKTRHLVASEMNACVREALFGKPLGHGVTLAGVRAERPVDIADGWTRVDVEVPRAPKKAGNFATNAIASFYEGDDVIARVAIPIDLAVSDEGASYDTARGATLTLVVRKSFVEIRTEGFAAADADVGDAIPVQLRPSGRILRARLVSKDEAIALEFGR